jgi:hypothetical protein
MKRRWRPGRAREAFARTAHSPGILEGCRVGEGTPWDRFLESWATHILARMRGRRHGSYARAALLILSAILAISLVIVANSATVEAERYSAYEDPEKPVISYLLSDAESADRFQTEFGLIDQEMKGVLAAIREENETLAREYAGSERIVEASGGLPNERAREKIAASDYD